METDMDWGSIVAATGAIAGVFGAAAGALGKSIADNASSVRKNNQDKLQMAIDVQSKQIEKQDAKIDILSGQVTNLQKAQLELTIIKTRLEMENAQFRKDIVELQKQVRSLGHIPFVAEEPLSTEGRVTTLEGRVRIAEARQALNVDDIKRDVAATAMISDRIDAIEKNTQG